MGVYIKGMEIPTSCWDCACYHHKVNDGYYDYDVCQASGTVFNDGYASVTGHKDHIDPFKQRLDSCPLIELPPHGRLIDADALLESIKEAKKKQPEISNVYDEDYFAVAEWVAYAPTIVPAEEGET